MLMHALERTGGPEEDRVKGLKDMLKATVMGRLGHFEGMRFYLVSTILDPRLKTFYRYNICFTKILLCRLKNAFFQNPDTKELARTYRIEVHNTLKRPRGSLLYNLVRLPL